MKIKTASGLILLWMNLCRFDGWTSLWNTIYIRPGFENDQGLIRHEAIHIMQIDRDGRILFMLKYLWFTLRYGYKNNPYEVEARKAQFGG